MKYKVTKISLNNPFLDLKRKKQFGVFIPDSTYRKKYSLKLDKKSQLAKDFNLNPNKQTIIWDVDDIVLNSAKTVLNILNERYLIPEGKEPKSIRDIKDWNFHSIHRGITKEEVYDIFGSDEFWLEVDFMKGFVELVNTGILNKYNNVFVTVTGKEIAQKKADYIYHMLKDRRIDKYFNGLIAIADDVDFRKDVVDMSRCIQIDDNLGNFVSTNSRLKILMKQTLETTYNGSFGNYKELYDNLYEINYYDELKEILEFNSAVEKL